jgi:hypothetical protein
MIWLVVTFRSGIREVWGSRMKEFRCRAMLLYSLDQYRWLISLDFYYQHEIGTILARYSFELTRQPFQRGLQTYGNPRGAESPP